MCAKFGLVLIYEGTECDGAGLIIRVSYSPGKGKCTKLSLMRDIIKRALHIQRRSTQCSLNAVVNIKKEKEIKDILGSLITELNTQFSPISVTSRHFLKSL